VRESFDAHILITPFAIPGFSDRHLDPNWFAYRLGLFGKYCVPSVVRQLRQDFTWCLGIDERLIDKHGQDLEIASAGRGVLMPVTSEGWVASLAKQVSKHGERIISSRLDSDDALAPEFIDTVQARAQPGWVLNLIDGAKYDTGTGRASRIKMLNNPFISFFSVRGESVIDLGGHQEVHQRASVSNYSTRKPMWLQVIHGDNVINSWSRYAKPTHPSSLVDAGLLDEVAIEQGQQSLAMQRLSWLMASGSHVVRHPESLLTRRRLFRGDLHQDPSPPDCAQ
jgi:hypothetical protein